MPDYILVLHEQPWDFSEMSAEDIEALIREYVEWSRGLEAKGK